MEEDFYPVLGEQSLSKIQGIPDLNFLPSWIREPVLVSQNIEEDKVPLEATIVDLLDSDLRQRIEENGLTHWFPIQSAVIPLLLKDVLIPPPLPPRDICIAAPTGSGKTLAYVIPIVQAIRNSLHSGTKALIMIPVKELALQVYKTISEHVIGGELNVLLLTGERDLGKEQKAVKAAVPDIVVATPGRLMDHLIYPDQSTLDLSKLRFLVIDEADRMLSDGDLAWLTAVEAAVYSGGRKRIGFPSYNNMKACKLPLQKLLLSATLSQDPRVLREWNLFQPKLFTVSAVDPGDSGRFAFPPELAQGYSLVQKENLKPLILFKIMDSRREEWRKVLCFVDSKVKSHRLRLLLQSLGEAESTIAECSADLPLDKRKRILNRFASGAVRILVCSDLVARGLDVASVDAVINYSPPKFLQNYTHRVGRTARAGNKGFALTLATKEEIATLKGYLEPVGQWTRLDEVSVGADELIPLHPLYKGALESVKAIIDTEVESAKRKQSGGRLPRQGNKRKFNRNK